MKYIFKVYDKNTQAYICDYELKNMGDWRSRWQRQKEIWDKKGNLHIERINTHRSDKDFIVDSVIGTNKEGNRFVAYPDKTDKTPIDNSRGSSWIKVKNTDKCKNCFNYIKSNKQEKSFYNNK